MLGGVRMVCRVFATNRPPAASRAVRHTSPAQFWEYAFRRGGRREGWPSTGQGPTSTAIPAVGYFLSAAELQASPAWWTQCVRSAAFRRKTGLSRYYHVALLPRTDLPNHWRAQSLRPCWLWTKRGILQVRHF